MSPLQDCMGMCSYSVLFRPIKNVYDNEDDGDEPLCLPKSVPNDTRRKRINFTGDH